MLKCIFIAGNLFIVSPDGDRAANLSMAQSVRSDGRHLVVVGMNATDEIPLPRIMTAEQAIRQCDQTATAEVMKLEAF
ncbi:hypothetical protein [Paracoccus sp. (in: a-proteobacteria)]|uniref:hypothetical protein n=1 Tax=Paracoccus sp. TaxID=267 RepID=UPI0028B16846|nr:hypothetical protein [Paracoccus sp. (in: a-proteobacteria)]